MPLLSNGRSWRRFLRVVVLSLSATAASMPGLTAQAAASDAKRPAVGTWVQWDTNQTFYRLEAGGDISCYSENGHDCKAGPVNVDRAQPLTCGAMVQREWHISGYESPDHWCNRAYAALFADWRFHQTQQGGILLATNPAGDVMCESYDAVNCQWRSLPLKERQAVHDAVLACANDERNWSGAQALRDCFGRGSTLTPSTPQSLRPLICGPSHRASYGSTGYDSPSHWCNAPRSTPWVDALKVGHYFQLRADGRFACYSESGEHCDSGPPNVEVTRWKPFHCGEFEELRPGVRVGWSATDIGGMCNRAFAPAFARWEHHQLFGFNGWLATNQLGDTMCLADEADNCLQSDASESAASVRRRSATGNWPLACGDMLRSLSANRTNGYDTPGHWCNTPRIVYSFSGKPVPVARGDLWWKKSYAFQIPSWTTQDGPVYIALRIPDPIPRQIVAVTVPVRTGTQAADAKPGSVVIYKKPFVTNFEFLGKLLDRHYDDWWTPDSLGIAMMRDGSVSFHEAKSSDPAHRLFSAQRRFAATSTSSPKVLDGGLGADTWLAPRTGRSELRIASETLYSDTPPELKSMLLQVAIRHPKSAD